MLHFLQQGEHRRLPQPRFFSGAGQQPRPGHRRVGHCAQEFGVVVNAITPIGFGPGVVEDKFAVRVGFEVTRRDGNDLRAFAQHEVMRPPSIARSQAAVLLEPEQKGVAQERIIVRTQCVPLRRINLGDVLYELGLNHSTSLPLAASALCAC